MFAYTKIGFQFLVVVSFSCKLGKIVSGVIDSFSMDCLIDLLTTSY